MEVVISQTIRALQGVHTHVVRHACPQRRAGDDLTCSGVGFCLCTTVDGWATKVEGVGLLLTQDAPVHRAHVQAHLNGQGKGAQTCVEMTLAGHDILDAERGHDRTGNRVLPVQGEKGGERVPRKGGDEAPVLVDMTNNGGEGAVDDVGEDFDALAAVRHQGVAQRGEAGDIDEHRGGLQPPSQSFLNVIVQYYLRNKASQFHGGLSSSFRRVAGGPRHDFVRS